MRDFKGKKNRTRRRISKPVAWNDEEFESSAALARRTGVTPTHVTYCIKNKKLLKGHPVSRL